MRILESLRRLRARPLSLQLVLASLVSVLGLGVVCSVGVISLQRMSALSSTALQGQMELFDNNTALQSLLYEKGFVSYYMLTRDRRWLDQLESSRQKFADWLEQAHLSRTTLDPRASQDEAKQLLVRIAREYGAYDELRRQVLSTFEAGRVQEAAAMLADKNAHVGQLLTLCQQFSQLGHEYAQRDLLLAKRSMQRLTALLLLSSVAGTLASLAMGFLVARRIDAALLEQRQRMLQHEKLSAIGEVAAKLAHEILNPLAGMKAAVQLLLRSGGQVTPSALVETSQALDHEISRVDQLVRRLVNYARPLAPQRQPLPLRQLLDAVSDAARAELTKAEVILQRDVDAETRVLDGDPLLLTQALLNLVINAVQVTPKHGQVLIRARKVMQDGRDVLALQVQDDGPGLTPAQLPKLFHPFFTTKAQGHGLGLAIAQNIVVEHGGRISARSREGSRGAIFEMLLPLSPASPARGSFSHAGSRAGEEASS